MSSSKLYLPEYVERLVERKDWEKLIQGIKSYPFIRDYFEKILGVEKENVSALTGEWIQIESSVALHRAICVGHDPLVYYFIDRRLCIEKTDAEEKTPLHYAAAFSKKGYLDELIEVGADINARDATGRTPLHYAAASSETDCLYKLIQAGADVNARDAEENTPLYYAVQFANWGAVRILNSKKASKDMRNKDGLTAVTLAVKLARSCEDSKSLHTRFLIANLLQPQFISTLDDVYLSTGKEDSDLE